MKSTLRRLDSTHRVLIALIGSLDPNLFAQRPAENRWSVAEVVHHLCLVEQRILKELTRNVAAPPVKIGRLKRLIPMRLVSLRFIRVSAPKTVEPLNPLPKDEALKAYDEVRARLKQFCSEHGQQRLQATLFRHPLLGDLDAVAAISLIAFHEQRHNKQIREILRTLER